MIDEDKVFKALADASRRKLLDRLRKKNGLTLSELWSKIGLISLPDSGEREAMKPPGCIPFAEDRG